MMKGCYIYVFNPTQGTCHQFHLEHRDYPPNTFVKHFLEDQSFRLNDIQWMVSRNKLVEELVEEYV